MKLFPMGVEALINSLSELSNARFSLRGGKVVLVAKKFPKRLFYLLPILTLV